MDVKMDNRNELFKRQEMELELESEKNPSFNEVRKMISEDFSKEEQQIDVYNIYGGFGKKKFMIKANLYDSKEDLENMKKLEMTAKQRKEDNSKENISNSNQDDSEEQSSENEEKAEANISEPVEDTKNETNEVKEEPAEEDVPVEKAK